MKHEAKQAEALKFTKIKKKESFLPALKSKGFLQDTNAISIGTRFQDARDLSKLSMPDKCIGSPTNIWKLQNLGQGSYFRREPGSEIDIYDMDYLKYMRARERGIENPTSKRYKQRRESEQQSLKSELETIKNQIRLR